MNRRTRNREHDHRLGSTSVPDGRGRGIRVGRVKDDVGVAEARRRFGGLDWGASVAGLLAALGTLLLLSGLVGAAGSIGYRYGASGEGLSIGGFVAGLVVLLLAFFVGGWVAGRVARYDGGRNGIMSVVLFLVLAAGLAALGAWFGDTYNLFSSRPDLPNWFSGQDLEFDAVATAAIAALVALVAGWFGGIVGAAYHKQADAVVAHTGGGVVGDERVVDVGDEPVAPGYAATGYDDGAEAPRATAGRPPRWGDRFRHAR